MEEEIKVAPSNRTRIRRGAKAETDYCSQYDSFLPHDILGSRTCGADTDFSESELHWAHICGHPWLAPGSNLVNE
jgi:hypothetical protein